MADGQLAVTSTVTGHNVIDVTPFLLAFRVYDSLAPVTPGPGCVSASPNEAICGGMIMSVRIVGGDGDDLLGLWDIGVPVIAAGGAGDDLIETGAGADRVDAGGGQDAVVGGRGDDAIAGGDGDDALEGGKGDDAIDGNAGKDLVAGGPDDDRNLSGGAGDDLVNGGQGDDTLHGEDGDDALVAKQGDDVVNTGEGNDRVYRGHEPPRRVTCSSRRAGRLGPRTVRCQLVAGRPSPTVWPRTQQSSTLARASSNRFPVYVRDQGAPRRLTVVARAKHTRKAWVCVTLTDGDGAFLKRFGKKTRIPKSTFRQPKPPSRSYFGEGRLTKHKCRTKT